MLRSLCLLLAALATVASAGTLSYSTTTTGEPTWTRPIAGTPPNTLSGTGVNVPYHSFAFFVDLDGTYNFNSTADGWDNYLFLYSTPFNPNSPLTNAITGDDDGNGGIGTSDFSSPLTAGLTYYLVTTGFSTSDLGAFTNTIDGPGNISPAGVPEPSTLLMLGGGLAVLARQRRTARI